MLSYRVGVVVLDLIEALQEADRNVGGLCEGELLCRMRLATTVSRHARLQQQ